MTFNSLQQTGISIIAAVFTASIFVTAAVGSALPLA